MADVPVKLNPVIVAMITTVPLFPVTVILPVEPNAIERVVVLLLVKVAAVSVLLVMSSAPAVNVNVPVVVTAVPSCKLPPASAIGTGSTEPFVDSTGVPVEV